MGLDLPDFDRDGPEPGLGGRATIGVIALANGIFFETLVPVEVA
jgi:hypothetical protein